MIAPPGRPKTSVIPRCSSVRRTAPEPVRISGVRRAPAAADSGVASVGMRGSLPGEVAMVRVSTLARDRALGGGLDELRELREDSAGVARGQRGPAFSAGLQLGVVDQ